MQSVRAAAEQAARMHRQTSNTRDCRGCPIVGRRTETAGRAEDASWKGTRALGHSEQQPLLC